MNCLQVYFITDVRILVPAEGYVELTLTVEAKECVETGFIQEYQRGSSGNPIITISCVDDQHIVWVNKTMCGEYSALRGWL